jgi:hypothetical protein
MSNVAKKIFLIILIVISLCFFCGCGANVSSTTKSSITTSGNTEITSVTTSAVVFDYINNTLPTNQIIRFELTGANQFWFWNGPPVFSPNGNEMYFTKIFSSWDESEIWYLEKINGVWSTSKKLVIEGISGYTLCPVFVSNPDEMYFMNLSLAGTRQIYKVKKIDGIWSNPEVMNVNLPSGTELGCRFSISDNGNIYFTLLSANADEYEKIYFSKYEDGIYSNPTEISSINGTYYGNGSPYIAPDESYIIFDSGRSSSLGVQDLYVSFRDELGNYQAPINLGSIVNTVDEEGWVLVSEDGLYLFFCAKKSGDAFYSPYWILLDEIPALQN